MIETIPASRGAGAFQVRWIAVDQFATLIVVIGQKPVRAAMNPLHRIVAFERSKRSWIEVDTDGVQRRRFYRLTSVGYTDTRREPK